MKITGRTKLLGVIGHPVAHSFSPLMHNAALAQMELDYLYAAFPIAPERLNDAITGFDAIGLVGFNITIPHKQTIIPLLADTTDLAKAVGAVNTVWQTAAGWHGTNTDVAGFISPLQAMSRDWSQTTVICLGNGGAARAVVVGAHQLGCQKIQVFGRNAAKLDQFYRSWQNSTLGQAITAKLSVHAWADLDQAIEQAHLIVNTTPIGMHPNADASPLSPAQAATIQAGTIAYDLIYVPSPTQFLQQAQAENAITLDGLEMLVQQGAAALKIWTNDEVPIDIMRSALQQHLGLT
ncbi:shikimate dehydrogenase [filamentous cyanobacterium LEGE 11480]|uniref:Shikimate dehydrogenase (NADP(+)) n=2 Tax=Romeriopsis TaxID=2992131 RepID=A0A928VL60_9CYAN|nr:shikimate dehydrogenase [Romeriopsis navalis LEGE 11480]